MGWMDGEGWCLVERLFKHLYTSLASPLAPHCSLKLTA
jgi:hypothetical protein